MKRSSLVLTAALLSSFLLAACGQGAAPSVSTEQAVRAALSSDGVGEWQLATASDGSVLVSGKLNANAFVARFPNNWNGQAVLFAHGYVNPTQSQQDVIPADPARQDPSGGVLSAAYAQNFAVAYSAYEKTGYAVKSGVDTTYRLKQFLDKVGAKRAYIAGASMGGNIAVALSEQYPNDFAGALPYCGVVSGWENEIRYLTDFRVVYDYFTAPLGAPFVLPGAGQATKYDPAYTLTAVQNSVGALFQGAKSNASLAGVIQQIAAVTGAAPDPVSFITALGGNVYGLQDLLVTAGGNPYGNTDRVYSGSAVDADLNAKVERITANTAALAYLKANYTPTGKFNAKVLSIHNTSDPLVPFVLETQYKAVVTAAGNADKLVQQTVQPKPVNFADLNNSGPAHCYFSPQELATAWTELRAWVENGVKPENGKDITNKPAS